jgi:catechol 2,3-dioxygenase-like lactoylglutathione lyase family enzyme
MPEIGLVTLVVRDYDEALAFYVGKLRWTLREDTTLGPGRRWVVVAPPGSGAGLLLAAASAAVQTDHIGDQTGGRVAFFIHTDDFGRDYAAMRAAGVEFLEAPRTEAYGTVVVWQDLYGNRWDLIGPVS